MYEVWLFLHFIGLALGIGVPIANMVAQRVAMSASPDVAAALRGLAPRLAPISTGGLVILWITGLIMISSRWTAAGVPAAFWVKFAAVVGLTAVVAAIWWTMGRIRGGDMAAAGRMKILGPAAGILGLIAILFAVIAFH